MCVSQRTQVNSVVSESDVSPKPRANQHTLQSFEENQPNL